jgi:vitamin B12 transporter
LRFFTPFSAGGAKDTMQHSIQASFSLLFLSISSILHAESVEKSESADTILSPITVTATRTERETKLASTTLIKRADIERLQVNSVEEALRGIAGVNLTNEGGVGKNTSVFLRGTNSSHIIVLVDGVRVGSVSDGRTAFQDLPINEIDSIEVIRGAKSSLYGSEAIGGVIHIHTRQGANSIAKPVFSASIGSHDRYRYSAGASGKIEKSWYNVNFTHDRTHGFNACDGKGGFSYGCFTDEPDKDGYQNYAGSARLGYQILDNLLIEGNFLYASGHNEYDGFFQNEGKFVQQIIGGQLKYQPFDFWTITFKGGQSRDRSQNFKDGVFSSAFNTERLTLNVQNDFKLSEGHLFSVGYDYLDDQLKTSYDYTQAKRDDHGVFAQYQGEYDNHQFVAGFRHDENQQFGSYNTWNVGYGYTFLNNYTFSASYGTAFKAPTFNDVYAPLGWGASPDLKPETAKNYEVSFKGKHDWGKWEINHYGNYINNLIISDSLWQLANISKARIYGVELIGETQIEGFNIRGNLSLLKPENREEGNTDKILNRRAQQIFRLDVDKKIDDFSFGTTVIAEGRRFDDKANTQRVGGFATLDLRAEYTLFKQLTLQAKVNNILNKQYQTVKGYNTDDLNFFFTLRYSPEL